MLSVSGVAEEGIDDDLSAFHVVLGLADLFSFELSVNHSGNILARNFVLV